MKIFLLGAGYVGYSLLSSFQGSLHEIIATTTTKTKISILKPFVKEVLLLNDKDPLPKANMDRCDALIVLVAPKEGKSYEETYLECAKKVISYLKQRDKPLFLIYTSSTSVYEQADCEWMDENSCLHPFSEKAKILLQTEKLFLQHENGCIFRLGGIYGPKRELIQRAKRMSGKKIPGLSHAFTNHIHVNDCTNAILYSLENQLKGIYNLVNDSHPTREDLYASLCKNLDIPPPIWSDTNSKGSYKVLNEKIKLAGYVFKHPTIENG